MGRHAYKYSQEDFEQALLLYQCHYSMREISEETGIGYGTLTQTFTGLRQTGRLPKKFDRRVMAPPGQREILGLPKDLRGTKLRNTFKPDQEKVTNISDHAELRRTARVNALNRTTRAKSFTELVAEQDRKAKEQKRETYNMITYWSREFEKERKIKERAHKLGVVKLTRCPVSPSPLQANDRYLRMQYRTSKGNEYVLELQ